MSELAYQSATTPGGERSVSGRDHEATPARCVMYVLFSDLMASPFDAEPVMAGQPVDLDALGLPYEVTNLQALLEEWRTADRDELRRVYSSLFEVGSDGPPVPIREDLHKDQPAGLREDIVRFYDFFGYGLQESFAWAPDHLSVELEFMHFLCFRELQMLESAADEADPLSYQLAQFDFAERHLCDWVPELATKVLQQNADGLYGRLLGALSEFLVKDYEWQAATIQDGA
jgi:DMSO reductase family type II enzyme chaperone